MANAKRAVVTKRFENETIESMLNRFKRKIEKENVLVDFYKHQEFEQPSQKRKRAKAAAKKREQRRVSEGFANRKMA